MSPKAATYHFQIYLLNLPTFCLVTQLYLPHSNVLCRLKIESYDLVAVIIVISVWGSILGKLRLKRINKKLHHL